MKNDKLIDARVFTDDGRWYMRLVYEYSGDDQKTHLRIYPKVEFPFWQAEMPDIIYNSCPSESSYWARLSLMPRYSVLLYESQDEEALKRGTTADGMFFDIILETEPKKMTLDEIEKELGYSVAIVKEKQQ